MKLFPPRADDRRRLELRRANDQLATAKAEVQRLRRAFDALPVGVVLADEHGVAQISNAAASKYTGHASVLVAEAIERQLLSAVTGVPCTQVVEFYGPPKRLISVSAVPIPEGGALAITEDVSERARLDAVRTDFVANISHELKTPVGALAVLAEALAGHDDPEVIRQLSNKMVDEAHRAASTIDDLLELSRIELGGRASLDAVELGLVIAEAIGRCRLAADRRDIAIEVQQPRPPAVLGDSRQLVSALTNLLDNAIKYSDPGSSVSIDVRRADGWVEIEVSDHGVGVPARDLDRIFERFYRVDRARSRDTGGTGLGLAIVRHVATNHGGDVRARSHEGEGSTFTLRIPAAATEEHT